MIVSIANTVLWGALFDMGNILFSLSIAIMALHLFTITYRVNGINRVLFNIPISIFETSIPLVSEGEFVAHFDKDLLEEKLTSYFNNNIKKYSNKYEFYCYYYNQSDDSYCYTDYCDAVEVDLHTNIVLTTEYHKKARFYIQRNL